MQEHNNHRTGPDKGRKTKKEPEATELVHNFSGQPIKITIGGETHVLSSMWFIEKVTPKDTDQG